MGDVQSRKWLLTINNPVDKGYTHEFIKGQLGKIKSCVYWCMSDEVGLMGGTPHTHIYIACSSAVRFSTLQKKFEGAHFDVARGTSQQNKEYVYKLGKWANSEKEDTRVDGTQEEWGDIPVEQQGKRNDLDDLYDMIKQGMDNYEILETNPQYLLSIDKIDKCRQTIRNKENKCKRREISCVYIYGATGTGKTRYVMDKYGDDKVYRVTDYKHPFDEYEGEDVIIFDEFRSDIPLKRMLQYMDIYSLRLPCRYANKQAEYTKIYIISNVGLRDQYTDIQRYEIESWYAFLRRINEVHVYTASGEVHRGTVDQYIHGFIPTKEGEEIFSKREDKR